MRKTEVWYMMDRAEHLADILNELADIPDEYTILVEGRKDRNALVSLGIDAETMMVQSGGGPLRISETLHERKRKAVILTDWDGKGDRIAAELERSLRSLGVTYDASIRSRLRDACIKDIKDVESLPSLYGRLTYGRRGRRMGKFVVFEGIDGSGKSSVCREVGRILRENGADVVITAEPTDGEIGKIIRAAGPDMPRETEALLFTADRADHTIKIKKWVGEGSIVLCDRYYASTLAYQSVSADGDAPDEEWLRCINDPVIIEPDMTFLLDVSPEKGMSRAETRGILSKFEKTGYLRRVRENYLRIAKEKGFAVIDAERSMETTVSEILEILTEE